MKTPTPEDYQKGYERGYEQGRFDAETNKIFSKEFNKEFIPLSKLQQLKEKYEKGCGEMYCWICNTLFEDGNAYCLEHARSTHYVCSINKICPTCKAKLEVIEEMMG